MPKYLNEAFSALSDPTRRAVVEHLTRGPATVSDLAAPFEMSLPAFVQHLQVLEKSGLVASRKQGRVRTCYLERAALDELQGWVNDAQKYWDSRIDALKEYAEHQHSTKSSERGTP